MNWSLVKCLIYCILFLLFISYSTWTLTLSRWHVHTVVSWFLSSPWLTSSGFLFPHWWSFVVVWAGLVLGSHTCLYTPEETTPPVSSDLIRSHYFSELCWTTLLVKPWLFLLVFCFEDTYHVFVFVQTIPGFPPWSLTELWESVLSWRELDPWRPIPLACCK